jgi:hypothetical protein
VPPEMLERNVFDWLTSMTAEVGDIVTVGVCLTVTVAVLDFAVNATLSVTLR